MDEKSLQEQLTSYKAAIEAEFQLSEQHQEGLDRASIGEKTRDMLTRAVPIAVSRLVYLVEHGDKETTQLSAAKYIIDYGLGKSKLENPDDPLSDLLKSLTKQNGTDAEPQESAEPETL
jgi:hypothetical protein